MYNTTILCLLPVQYRSLTHVYSMSVQLINFTVIELTHGFTVSPSLCVCVSVCVREGVAVSHVASYLCLCLIAVRLPWITRELVAFWLVLFLVLPDLLRTDWICLDCVPALPLTLQLCPDVSDQLFYSVSLCFNKLDPICFLI